MARRVLLHVGTPKTATTYLQDVLFRNRDVLARHGVHYPCDTFDAQFRAALDLLRREWGGLEDQVVGEWDALADRVRALDGTVVVSNEILAGATPEQARRAVDSLGGEVELVLTARDLMRQIPAEWQETVKHFGTETYPEFLAAIRSREGRTAGLFWGVQDLPAIVERWGVEAVHLVTLPQHGTGDGDELWPRLRQAFALDGVPLDLATDRANSGLGMPEATLLRDLNERAGVLSKEEYRRLVMELLAHRTLAARRSPKIGVPLDVVPWVQETASGWVEQLKGHPGVRVIGDLDDLLGAPAPYTEATPGQVGEAAQDAVVALLTECARLIRQREPGPREALRILYRRARGRSSRLA